MGRPFIVYSSDEEGCSVGTSQSFKEWAEEAKASLEDAGLVLEDINSRSLIEVLEWIYSLRRPAYLPLTGSSDPGASIGVADSKIGGLPYLLPGEAWPTNTEEDTPMTFVAQFQVEELPAKVQETLGVEEGLFQVFLDESLPSDCGDEWFLVRVLQREDIIHTSSSSGASMRATVPECVNILHEKQLHGFEMTSDWPQVEDIIDLAPAHLDMDVVTRVADALNDCEIIATCGGDKLLGWPNWCQGSDWSRNDAGARYYQVLQLEGNLADINVGDSGTILIQLNPDKSDFAITWACC